MFFINASKIIVTIFCYSNLLRIHRRNVNSIETQQQRVYLTTARQQCDTEVYTNRNIIVPLGNESTIINAY